MQTPMRQSDAMSNYSQLDQETAQKVRQLMAQKDQAVAVENFELAKSLRDQIDNLKQAGA